MISIRKNLTTEIKYIFFLFIITRIVLTLIGVSSYRLLEPIHVYDDTWHFSKHLWLDIWGLWDSGYYLSIAKEWYPAADIAYNNGVIHAKLGFFPLYPLLIRIIGLITRDNFISGLLISNACLIITGLFLFKLVGLDNKESTALNSIKYLFLFPASFILSAVFTESLFLALIVISFYYSKKENWLYAGIAGFFSALARPQGMLILLPLCYEYFKTKNFIFKNIRPDVLLLLFIPLGTLLYMGYTYYLTGDFLAYFHVKQALWHFKLTNPLVLFLNLFRANDIAYIINVIYAFIVIIVLCIFFKKIGFSQWLLGMMFVLLPLINGLSSLYGVLRFGTAIFPIYILSAKLAENCLVDKALVISLVLIQGFLMVFWSTGFRLMI